MENGRCDRCERDVLGVAGIKRPLDPAPQPYVACTSSNSPSPIFSLAWGCELADRG